MYGAVRIGLGGLFAIAAIGVLSQNLQPPDSFGTALALSCLCVDQGRMALVDFNNIRQVTLQDRRVRQLLLVILVTIAIQLTGFYLACWWLGLGTALVLVSQLFFNTAAKIRLVPNSFQPIQPFELAARTPVLIANTLALGSVILWQSGQYRQTMSGLLLAMVLTYLSIKYLSKPLSSSTVATVDEAESP